MCGIPYIVRKKIKRVNLTAGELWSPIKPNESGKESNSKYFGTISTFLENLNHREIPKVTITFEDIMSDVSNYYLHWVNVILQPYSQPVWFNHMTC